MAQRFFVYCGNHMFAVVHAADEKEAVAVACRKTTTGYDPKECKAVQIELLELDLDLDLDEGEPAD